MSIRKNCVIILPTCNFYQFENYCLEKSFCFDSDNCVWRHWWLNLDENSTSTWNKFIQAQWQIQISTYKFKIFQVVFIILTVIIFFCFFSIPTMETDILAAQDDRADCRHAADWYFHSKNNFLQLGRVWGKGFRGRHGANKRGEDIF